MICTLRREGGRAVLGGLCAALIVAFGLAGCAKEKENPVAGGQTGNGATAGANGATDPDGNGVHPAPAAGQAEPPKAVTLGTDPLGYILPDALVYFQVRPQRVSASPLVKALPEQIAGQVDRVATDNPLSIDPRSIELAAAFIVPKAKPAPTTPDEVGEAMDAPDEDPSLGILVRSTEPLNGREILEKTKGPQDKISEQSHNGSKYLQIVKMRIDFFAEPDEKGEPKWVESARFGVVTVDEMTIFGGTEDVVKKVLDGGIKPGPLSERLKGVSLDADLIVAAVPAANPESTAEATSALPVPVESLGVNPEEMKSLLVTVDLTGGTLLGVSVEGTSSDVADRVETAARSGQQILVGLYQKFTTPYRADEAPEGIKGLLPYGDQLVEGIAVDRKGNEVSVTIKSPGEWDKVVAAALPAIAEIQAEAQKAAKKAQQANAFKQIGIAFHNHNEAFGTIPPRENGFGDKLSWRVHLLPFLDETELYSQFNLEEPWDSEQNKPLIEKMPAIFATDDVEEHGKTKLVGFTGDGAPIGTPKGLNLAKFSDGTSNTILLVEAAPEKAVVWTKPDDLPFNAEDPKAALGKLGETFRVLFADGSVKQLPASIDNETLKALITHSGGEEIDPTKLQP